MIGYMWNKNLRVCYIYDINLKFWLFKIKNIETWLFIIFFLFCFHLIWFCVLRFFLHWRGGIESMHGASCGRVRCSNVVAKICKQSGAELHHLKTVPDLRPHHPFPGHQKNSSWSCLPRPSGSSPPLPNPGGMITFHASDPSTDLLLTRLAVHGTLLLSLPEIQPAFDWG